MGNSTLGMPPKFPFFNTQEYFTGDVWELMKIFSSDIIHIFLCSLMRDIDKGITTAILLDQCYTLPCKDEINPGYLEETQHS